MTALAMVLGMLPMSLGLGAGGEQYEPLGRAVIGGLSIATFSTLFFVPVMYSLMRKKQPKEEDRPRSDRSTFMTRKLTTTMGKAMPAPDDRSERGSRHDTVERAPRLDTQEHATSHDGEVHTDKPRVPKDEEIGHTQQPKRSLWLAAIVIIAVLVLALAVGIIPRLHTKHKLEEEAEARANALPKVTYIVAHEAGKISKLELPGTIQPLRDTSVYARVSGYVRAWHVDIGDEVKEGQLLVELDTPELDQQVKLALAALLQAKSVIGVRVAVLHLARQTLDRYDKAKIDGVPGAISERDLDTQRSAVASAIASLAAAQADVEAARADVSTSRATRRGFARVLAQFPGRITTRSVEIGQLVSEGTGQILFHLVQANPLRVFVYAPQRFAPIVRVGQDASVHVREHADRDFKGTVMRAAESIDQVTRTMLVEVHVRNDDGALLPGMFGEVKLDLETPAPAIEVPSTALIVSSRGTRIAVVQDDNTIAYRIVVVGRDNGDTLEILSGLNDGDKVVTNLAVEVDEGTKVDATERKKPQQKGKAPAGKRTRGRTISRRRDPIVAKPSPAGEVAGTEQGGSSKVAARWARGTVLGVGQVTGKDRAGMPSQHCARSRCRTLQRRRRRARKTEPRQSELAAKMSPTGGERV